MLEVFADRTDVPEVVVLLDQTVEEPLLARPAHLSDLDRTNFIKGRLESGRVDLDPRSPLGRDDVVWRDLPNRWK